MARYTYNAGLVTQTLETLDSACNSLDNTNVDIKKGIDMIWNARGAENMNIDFSPITGYQSTVVEHIEMMSTEIRKKAQEIEEYQDAPWYKKLFATIGMGALKLVEGLATFVENIGDGLVSIVGFIGGIFSSEFKNSVAEFVRTDYVGETTAKWYEEGWLKDVNKYSYMSHESTAANILKGVGTAAGYVILTVATAGAGTAVSLGVSTAAAAAGGIGSGTQEGLKEAQLMNPEMSAGDAFNSAFAKGVKQGATAAATTLITAGVAKGISNMAGQAANVAANGGNLQMITNVANSADEIAALGKGAKLLNGAKQLVNKGANLVFNNKVGLTVLTKGASAASAISSAAPAGLVTLATKAAPGIAGAIGATASGQFTQNATTQQIDQAIQEASTPSVAEQLYTEGQEVLQGEDALPEVATEEEAKENYDQLIEEGYNPGGEETPTGTPTPEGTPAPGDSTPVPTSSSSGPSGPSPSGTQPAVTVTPVEMPEYTTQPTQPAPAVTTPSPYTPEEQIISTIKPGIDPVPTSGPGNPGVSTLTDPTNVEDVTKETVSSEVLDTFGDVSGSLSGLSSTKSSIPTSSSPILSSDGGSSSGSKFVPLGAGLGAASIAGIGAKAYLDKREKSKEEESDDIETEEWATQDDVEIDYGLETDSEEADYLSPTDELAFTE